MQKTVSKLKQSITWLEEAVKLVEKNDLESLLKYYQVGYKGYGWHLQQFVLSQEFEVERELAKHLKEVFGELDFTLPNDIESPMDFNLLFKGEKVGFLDVYKRTLWFDISAENRIYQIKNELNSLGARPSVPEKDSTVEEEILEEKNPQRGRFFAFAEKKNPEVESNYSVEHKRVKLEETLEYYTSLHKQTYELLDLLLEHGFTLEYRG